MSDWDWFDEMPRKDQEIPNFPRWAHFAEENRAYWGTRLGESKFGVMAIGEQRMMGIAIKPHVTLVRIRDAPNKLLVWDWTSPIVDLDCQDYGETLQRAAGLRDDLEAIALLEIL